MQESFFRRLKAALISYKHSTRGVTAIEYAIIAAAIAVVAATAFNTIGTNVDGKLKSVENALQPKAAQPGTGTVQQGFNRVTGTNTP
ncbi:TPA: Flp family type IVb pilin [Vibrio vulnificus]|nr:Flp family type IVb pilin [Vibrio vulnificus]HDY8012848.1 Flp family type IVb pilin [Vibrio vulnificus]